MTSNLEKSGIENSIIKKKLPYFIRPLWRSFYSLYARVMFYIKLIVNNK